MMNSNDDDEDDDEGLEHHKHNNDDDDEGSTTTTKGARRSPERGRDQLTHAHAAANTHVRTKTTTDDFQRPGPNSGLVLEQAEQSAKTIPRSGDGVPTTRGSRHARRGLSGRVAGSRDQLPGGSASLQGRRPGSRAADGGLRAT
ncbi:hypothetical protein ISCGN_006764 [Ixodes scapularis]